MTKDNSAHDLSAFSPRDEQEKPELRIVRPKPRAFAGALTLRALVPFAIVMCFLSIMVYNQVYLNELTREVSALNRQLAILESDGIRYASLLESTVSLRTIAQQAEEMGMVRLDQYRTVHVYLVEEDIINLFRPAEQPQEASGILAMLGSIINSAKEYIARM